MNLSKSRYCRALQCMKMLWLEQNKPDAATVVDNSAILEQGNQVHEVARYLFGEHINIEYTDNLSEMVKDTYRTIESYKDVIITEASFNYENNFCSVDILVKNNNNYEIYEVKSSTDLEEVYINDASYQYYVLTSLGFKVTKCTVVIIDRNYERHGPLELDKLFKKIDITNEVINLKSAVFSNIKEINTYLEQESEPYKDITRSCFEPYDCPFFKYCIKDLPVPSVFDITLKPGVTGLKYYQEGRKSLKDLLDTNINKNQRQYIEYELYDKEAYIDKLKIKEFLDTLSYPLYFLDFETYQMAIPLYDNIHPYEKIPFQYSLHYYENTQEKLEHKEFLAIAGEDPRRKLAESLVANIPLNVTTLAYNMGFEKGVIKKLAKLYPDLSDHLLNIHANIKDLMIPFRNHDYYTKDMHGSYSIKYVLPALFPNDKELDYHNLELVHNGAEAMDVFKKMAYMDQEELKYTRERLLKYCGLDTYAMVKIYQKLKEKSK